MGSLPILSILEKANVSPPPATATITHTSLPLTFIDTPHIVGAPIHFVLFYQIPQLTKTEFIEKIAPKLKHSLSITLQHFLPFAGNIIVYPSTNDPMPEIRYVEGDSVKVTFAESNLDFNDLTGYHPRNCDKFYDLIPPLGDYVKLSYYIKVPVFSLQITFFPNCGFSIGVTYSHSLADGGSLFCFLNAWTSIAQCGTDESFLANGNLPFYERVVNYPERDKTTLSNIKIAEKLFETEFEPPKLPSPNDKLRSTFVLTKTVIDQLKKLVLTELPDIPYVSSFTVTCAYVWSCIAKVRKEDNVEGFMIAVDARRRLDPPIPASYFGNCATGNMSIAKPANLTGKEGFINAAKMVGENLHRMLNDKDGILEDKLPEEVKLLGWPKSLVVIYGSPKLRYYDLDFGWGKPKKFEILYMDHGFTYGTLLVPIDGGKEFKQDMEISICLTATQMETFATAFNQGLKSYISDP